MANVEKDIKENLHRGHRQRMKNKIAQHGVNVLHDHELLEYLLYPFIPRKDTNPIAHKLLNTFGDMYTLINTKADNIAEVSGVTRDAALFLSSLSDVFRRCAVIGASKERRYNKNISDAAAYFCSCFQGLEVEVIFMLCLDDTSLARATYHISSGDSKSCATDIRDFVKKASAVNASQIYVGHNHPASSPCPSKEDDEFTQRLYTAIDAIGVAFIDHIIVGSGGAYFSYRLNGLLECEDED